MIGKKLTLDTSVIIKGTIPPKKSSANYEEKNKDFEIASEYMRFLFSGSLVGFISSVALIEISAVGARLTGSKQFGMTLARKVEEVCVLLYDEEILDDAIGVGAQYRASGFDTLFLTCAILTGTPLFTDDRKLHDLCRKAQIESYLLNEMR